VLKQLAKFVFEMAQDVEYLLDRHPELGPGQMGGEIYHPTARERAAELRTTLNATQKLFEVNPESHREKA
jgi:hypothetical protein